MVFKHVKSVLLMSRDMWVLSHLCVCGMAANAVFGGPRMGHILGGMLLSGQKMAQMISERLRQK